MMNMWNPWHGCKKISPGCEHCYMYYLDKKYDKDGSVITKSKTNFNYPIKKNRDKTYKVKPGQHISVCMTSDFFLEEADVWRDEAWDIIRQRPDVHFSLLTKRAERIEQCLPVDWGEGYDNVSVGVTTENQEMADKRLPILLSLPAKMRTINCSPLIGPLDLSPYLDKTKIQLVLGGGENYDGCRVCRHCWIESLKQQCKEADIQFCFHETGTKFEYKDMVYTIPTKREQTEIARLLELHYEPNKKAFPLQLKDLEGKKIELPEKHFRKRCETCNSKFFCDGCDDCGKCEQ